MKKYQHYIFPILIALAAAIPFWVCTRFGFLFFDDGQTIYHNPLIKNPTFWGLLKARIVGMYVPVSAMFYALVYRVAGENAGAFHVFSILLHVCTSVAVFYFVKKLLAVGDLQSVDFQKVKVKSTPTKSLSNRASLSKNEMNWIAFFSAALFAVHPVKAEPVCWIAAQTTLTYSFFYMLSLTAWLEYRISRAGRWYALSLLMFALSGFSKSAAVTLPLLLLVLDRHCGRLRQIADLPKILPELIPFLAISLALGIYTFYSRAADGAAISFMQSSIGAFDRLLMVCHSILFYIYKLIVPIQLTLNYPMEKSSGSWSIDYYLSPFILGILLYFFIKKAGKTHRASITAAALYLIPLSIMLPVFSVGTFELRSDRYLYIPSLGVFLMLLLLLRPWLFRQSDSVKWDWKMAPLALVVCVYGLLAHIQSKIWRDDESVFENCVRIYPDNATCNCNLAYGALLNHHYEKAVDFYTRTLKKDASFAESYNGRGQAYFELKKFQEAYQDFDAAIKAGLVTPRLFLNRAKCLVILNRHAEAKPDLQRSLELEPKHPETHYFSGLVASKMGNAAEAIAAYTQAIALHPHYIEARVNRGLLLMQNERLSDAITDFDAALQANPNVVLALNNRAVAYHKMGKHDLALRDASRAIEIQPDYRKAYETRAAIYLALGKTDMAAADMAKFK